jgi:hypothetical protein
VSVASFSSVVLRFEGCWACSPALIRIVFQQAIVILWCSEAESREQLPACFRKRGAILGTKFKCIEHVRSSRRRICADEVGGWNPPVPILNFDANYRHMGKMQFILGRGYHCENELS